MSQMAISQPIFDSLVCAETKCEQLLQTELRKIKRDQISTKSFTKVQKTLVRDIYSSDGNKSTSFQFPNMC